MPDYFNIVLNSLPAHRLVHMLHASKLITPFLAWLVLESI